MINKSGSTTLGVAQVVEHMEHLANPVNGALYSLLPPTVLAGYCILIPILFGFSIFFSTRSKKNSPETEQGLRCAVFRFHSCACRVGISHDLLQRLPRFGSAPKNSNQK